MWNIGGIETGHLLLAKSMRPICSVQTIPAIKSDAMFALYHCSTSLRPGQVKAKLCSSARLRSRGRDGYILGKLNHFFATFDDAHEAGASTVLA
jgi:hypothetical protein